jgi:mannose-binding lectin 1
MLRLASLALTVTVAFVAARAAPSDGLHRGDVSPPHSLEAPYIHDWWIEGVPHWDIGGDAVVTADFVRLTPNQASRFGYAWSTLPVDFKSWEARLAFYARSRSVPGADGFALWYAETPYKGPRAGPVLGMTRNFRGIGILFDSYDNDNLRDNPVVVGVNNVRGDINTWDPETDFSRSASFRCQHDFRRSTAGPVELVLTYAEERLTAKLINPNHRNEVICGSIPDLQLPTGWYFGLTATTGGVSDNHDIISFTLRPVGETSTPSLSVSFDHAEEHKEKLYWSAKEEQK